MTAGWTEDRVGALKKLWLEGQSASQIAKQLGGGVTRNAVIGKVHRLGLSGRAAPSQPARRHLPPFAPRPAAQPTQTPSAPRRIEAVQPRAAAVPSVPATDAGPAGHRHGHDPGGAHVQMADRRPVVVASSASAAAAPRKASIASNTPASPTSPRSSAAQGSGPFVFGVTFKSADARSHRSLLEQRVAGEPHFRRSRRR